MSPEGVPTDATCAGRAGRVAATITLCLTCDPVRAVALSPEGVPTDATCALAEPAVSPPGPDVIVNINADSTAAFAAWAMGSAGGGAPEPARPAAPRRPWSWVRAVNAHRHSLGVGWQPCLENRRVTVWWCEHPAMQFCLVTSVPRQRCACKACIVTSAPEGGKDRLACAEEGGSMGGGGPAARAGDDASRAAGAAAGMTPSREVTPQLRRRSTRGSLAAAAASVRRLQVL